MEHKILILTAYTTNILWNNYGKNDYIETSVTINKKYADAHGYDFKWVEFKDTLDGFSPSWIKIKAINDALNEATHDYICWIDADAIFVGDMSLDFMKGNQICLSKALVFEGKTLTTTSTGLMLIENTLGSKYTFRKLMEYAEWFNGGIYKTSNWHEQGLLDKAFVDVALVLKQSDFIDEDFFGLLEHTDKDLSKSVSAGIFKIIPNKYHTDDENNVIFVFHAAGDTTTKASRLKKFLKVDESDMKKEREIRITFFDKPKVDVLGDKPSRYLVQMIDKDINFIVYQETITNNMFVESSRRYFVNWRIIITDISDPNNKKVIETFDYDLKNKRVYIRFDSAALGDNIAWMAPVEEFRKKHKCKVICATFWNQLFKKAYPLIQFVTPNTNVNNIYARYDIGWFEAGKNPERNPTHPRLIPLQQTCTDILGLDYNETVTNIDRI